MAKGFSTEIPDDKKAQDLPKDDMQEAIDENFETRKKEKIEKIEDAFEKAISGGSQGIDERALVRLRELKQRQKKAVSDLFAEKKKTYDTKAKANLGARQSMADEILKSADDEAQQRITALEAIIQQHKTGEYITTDEAYEIEKAVFSIDEMIKKNPDMIRLAEKIREGKSDLTPAEYLQIVKIMNPYDILKQRGDLQQTFEATSVGALIGIMKPDQRYHLVEVFMDSEKKDQSLKLIDSFLRTGILSKVQGEKLTQIAVAKGLLNQSEFERDWKVKFESGYYQQEVDKLRQVMEEEKVKDYRGMFSENLMERVTGRPLVGGIMALWGTILMGINIAANMGAKGSRWQQLSTLKSNPYFYAGLGGMLAGTEIATGNLKAGSEWMGSGVIGRGIDSLTEGGEDESKTAFEKQMKQKMVDKYLNSPKAVEEYLDNGGFETMAKVREEKLKKKELPLVKIDDLIMAEKIPTQIARLNDIKTNPYVSQEKIESDLTIMVEAAFNAGVSGNSGFVAAIEQSKKDQTPGALASGVKLPENKGFKPTV